jgi:hypothetical protein
MVGNHHNRRWRQLGKMITQEKIHRVETMKMNAIPANPDTLAPPELGSVGDLAVVPDAMLLRVPWDWEQNRHHVNTMPHFHSKIRTNLTLLQQPHCPCCQAIPYKFLFPLHCKWLEIIVTSGGAIWANDVRIINFRSQSRQHCCC